MPRGSTFPKGKLAGLLSAALLVALASPMRAQEEKEAAGESPEARAAADASPASRRLPFLGEEARKRGYELPLAFGAALVVTGLTGREVEVDDVRVGIGGDPTSVSRFVDLGSTSDVANFNLKLDAWLLPFLNVYGLVGWVHNESATTARVTLPVPGPNPGERTTETLVETELEGLLGGGGVTVAGGWKRLFVVADASYVQTDLGFDDAFTALIATLRAGWNGRIGNRPTQIWLGVGNWDTAATASGHATLDDGSRLDFEADQRPATAWMYDVGTQIEFSKRFQLVLDLGSDFEGGTLFVAAPTYRF